MRRLVLACFAMALMGCPDGNPRGDKEICDNRLDDDGDSLTDCMDDDCLGSCPELCGDLKDNDGDGATDCDDADCDGTCGEVCGDARDNDLDGLTDCDDPDCYGGCAEICDDGADNDGDGDIDCADDECAMESCPEDCYDGRDNDLDGFIDCEDSECDGDCPEVCDDGRDNDGDGDIDCLDRDCDGQCPEVCDDGRDNDGDHLWDCEDPDCEAFCDQDRDGFQNWAYGGDDCDDSNPDAHPGAVEVCNGFDDDCNGQIDEDDPYLDVTTLRAFHPDGDEDGFGQPGEPAIRCFPPTGAVGNGLDCDDTREDVNPAMPEICNDIDDDCDSLIDDADPSVDPDSYLDFYPDGDGDGFGVPGPTVRSCSTPEGTADNDDDCDDEDPLLGEPTLWYPDADHDGYGAGESDGPPSCEAPGPWYGPEAWGLDCEDGDPTIHPDAEEICEDLIDQDCDGVDSPCGPTEVVLFVTDTFLGSAEATWLWSRDDANAYCADYAADNGIAGTDFQIVYSNPEEDARDYLTYLPGTPVLDRYGAVLDSIDLWDGSDIRLPDMKSWTISGTWDDGRYHECAGGYDPGIWPICQYCANKFACGSSSDNPFKPSACCWTGTRAVVCMGGIY
jgi:large repetitive protein